MSVGYAPGLFAVAIAVLFVLILFLMAVLEIAFFLPLLMRMKLLQKTTENFTLRRTMMETTNDKKEKTTGKGEKAKTSTPSAKQPFYCHWKDGEWDGKFRDKDGNIVE
jgi:hypothetical protein